MLLADSVSESLDLQTFAEDVRTQTPSSELVTGFRNAVCSVEPGLLGVTVGCLTAGLLQKRWSQAANPGDAI